MAQFQCKMCGNCCRNLRGRTDKKYPPPLPAYMFGNVPHLERTITLFEWETQNLGRKAKELNLDFKAKPDYIIWDDVSEVPLVLQWNLDHDNCPFISDENKCLVQDEKPFVCQSYPLLTFRLLDEERMDKEFYILDCPNTVPLRFGKITKTKVNLGVFFREALKIYDDTFIAAVKFDAVGRILSEFLEKLTHEWIIYPAIIDKTVEESINRQKPIGFLEHLQRKSPDYFQAFKERLDSLSTIEEAIRSNLRSARSRKPGKSARAK